jgi:hypothetical protein
MSKLASNYKLLSNLDLARNDLFNVSKIAGNQYDKLGKDLEITTWDADTTAGDLVLHAGVSFNTEGDVDSNNSGRIFLFAGKENTSADGLFNETEILENYIDIEDRDDKIYRGIQLNPDSSISAYSLKTIKAVSDESVSLISGNTKVNLGPTKEDNKKFNTFKIITTSEDEGATGYVGITTDSLEVVTNAKATLKFDTLNQTAGPENNPYYSLQILEDSDTSGIFSTENIDSITIDKKLSLGEGSKFSFSGGDYILNSAAVLDIDAATSINIDSPQILIGSATTSTVASDGSKNVQEINQVLGIYSRANDFILEAGKDSKNPGTSTLQVTDANINGALRVYGDIALGKNTGLIKNPEGSKISVSKKLILESPEFEIKYTDDNSSFILKGTLKEGTAINATTVTVTKLISATEFNANGTSIFKGSVTVEDDSDNNDFDQTSIKSSNISISNEQGKLKVSEKTVELAATESTLVDIATLTCSLNTLTSTASGGVSLANKSTYSNRAGNGITGSTDEDEYAYKVTVTKDDKENTEDPDTYTADVTTHTLNARTLVTTSTVQATDKVEASKLYVGNKYWVYYDADTSSLVFSKVS